MPRSSLLTAKQVKRRIDRSLREHDLVRKTRRAKKEAPTKKARKKTRGK